MGIGSPDEVAHEPSGDIWTFSQRDGGKIVGTYRLRMSDGRVADVLPFEER